MSAEPLHPAGQWLVALARALHESGAPAHRLEETVDQNAQALGVAFACLSQPTSLILGIGGETRVIRVQPHTIHLERLINIDEVGVRVAKGTLSPGAGLAALSTIAASPERYGSVMVVFATAVSSATAAVFLHGSASTVALAGGLGLGVGILARIAVWRIEYGRLHELVASFVVAATATALARVVPVPVGVLTLAGIISLLPGLSLTVALTELATRHLASGTARAMGAAVTFLQIGLGTALGWHLAEALPKALRNPNLPLDDGWVWAAVPLAAAAFTVALRARPRDFPSIALVAGLSYLAGRFGQAHLGPELGASIGGLSVGLLSNLHARILRVPTAVTQVPGLLLLVPGSIGFRGFGAMLDADVNSGVSAAFSMTVIAGSLVAGILAAGVILPPRRSL
ncbi:membrane protein [Deltaproteobacteria bacterium]|nr:membrane protein [Deltaproteobacteria bacterium]